MSIDRSDKAIRARWRPKLRAATATIKRATKAAGYARRVIARHSPKPKRPRNISARGLALIKSFEGYRSAPYRDAVGVWTIGYGHTAGIGPNTKPISERQAAALLRQDLDRVYCPPVRRLPVKLNQHQFDALVSLVYNLGPGILGPSHTIGNALRRGDMKAAADAFLLYDHAGGHELPGLKRRREAERRLFLS